MMIASVFLLNQGEGFAVNIFRKPHGMALYAMYVSKIRVNIGFHGICFGRRISVRVANFEFYEISLRKKQVYCAEQYPDDLAL